MGNLRESDFATDDEKWQFLRDAPAVDAQEPAVRAVAEHLMAAAQGHIERFVRLAMAFARDAIRYESDTVRTGGEDIQRKGELSDILNRGTDDCDGKARLFVALCLAGGVQARMVDHWRKHGVDPFPPVGPHGTVDTSHPNADLYHVSAEVLMGPSKWVPAELTLYRARLGDDPTQFPRSVPKEVSGHWSRNDVGEALP